MTGRTAPHRYPILMLLAVAALLPLHAQADTIKFRTPDGRTLHTNIPERYRGRASFQELGLKTITVEKRYVRGEEDLSDATKAEVISHYARTYGLNENLVYAVISTESAFDERAVSKAGARGLMQLMPGTAAEMGVTDIFDVTQNIAGGTQYLAKMLEIFDNDKTLALAAYNAGPGTVSRYGGVPPYQETKNYVAKVQAAEKQFRAGGRKLKLDSLARIDAPVRAPSNVAMTRHRPDTRDYLVKFKSGLTQPADQVKDEHPHWEIIYGRRSYRVSKDMVAEIVSTR